MVLEASEGKSNATIAHELSTSVETVRLWRGRWVAQQAIKITDRTVEERLADAPHPGVPARISAEQRCQIEALACSAPSQSGRLISQWTGREIADELVREGLWSRSRDGMQLASSKRGLSTAPVPLLADGSRRSATRGEDL